MVSQVSTLPELLLSRTSKSSSSIVYLDSEGEVIKSLSYLELLDDASRLAQCLLASGLRPRSDIVITSFPDHESHIRVFWACCLAGIYVCPIPPLHPDPSRRALLFKHLEDLFHGPTLISDEQTIVEVKSVAPIIKALPLTELESSNTDNTFRESIFPARNPRPDDIVCLMLTSGSTGNSKAVALRHSNLLSSIRGKVLHHSTTPQSRFLNWIAFDHVACVSEVHLQALEANASQYHVAPSAIIKRPRSLLEWCSRLRITYSFSPNFLLAQICRDVALTPFPAGSLDLRSMQAFISGGEAVPIKTAIEFSNTIGLHGAPRNTLRAGFGMSETGAGCIYDTRPIVSDPHMVPEKYLSLGECCDGTNMRIVSPSTGEVCSAFQVGQLQLQGSSVFREYYNNTKATAEAFSLDGWFITGDNAQLDQDGNLHLVGRDKDLININGVKHPSVDVEHFVEDSTIEGVMRSFVYVCPLPRLPDTDTETYAVFYQHAIRVEDDLSPEELAFVSQATRNVRNACIVFCSQAPHIVLPLPRKFFSKTALGKISRTALVSTYLQGAHNSLELKLRSSTPPSPSSECMPRNSVEEIVFKEVASTFGLDVSSLNHKQNLYDLGASSMHLMRLRHSLQTSLDIHDVPTIEMLRRPEIGDLCEYLSEITAPLNSSISTPAYSPLICLNPNGSKPPLFMIHPGVGEVLVFIKLARVLDDDRPVYALRARGFDTTETTFGSFDEMVDEYTSAIEACFPSGPYFIGGYSFGGAIAFEVGKSLESRGKHVAWLGILNLPPHIQFRMKELIWIEVLVNLLLFLSLIPPTSSKSLRADLYCAFPTIHSLDKEPNFSAEVIDWLLEHSDQSRLEQLQLNTESLQRWTRVAYDMSALGRTFEPRGAVRDALTAVFCAIPLPTMGNREQYKRNHLLAWKQFSGKRCEFVDVEGEHYTMLDGDHIDSFVVKLRESMLRAIHLPAVYHNPTAASAINVPRDFDEVPIIDFSLANSDPMAYFENLRHALEDVGFGVLVNVPGFEDDFQKDLFALSRRLFQKPQEWKNALGTANSPALRGYFRGDDIPGPNKAHAEAYRFGLDSPEPVNDGGKEVPFWLRLHEGPNQWPAEADLPLFREKIGKLFTLYRSLNHTLNHHICRLLDIPQAALDDYFPEKSEFNSAIWHYLPLTPEIRAAAVNGFAQGMHEHRDPSTFLTCLIQSRQGLQVQNHSGVWIDVPMVKGGVVCNIGMQLMKLTGGRLVATTHRVNTMKIEEDRYTIPYVLSTKLDKPVVPLPQYSSGDAAKAHVAPNAKIIKLMEIEDPLVRSGYARLSLFPAASQKLYPKEFDEARRLGIL